jgi:chemotaxis protein methyltransferase CheR
VYGRARDLIASRLGLDFVECRKTDLERGLLCACRCAPASDPETYLTWLANLPEDSPEWRRLAGHLTVGETYFFRDRACFEALEQRILPTLIARRREDGNLRLRLWSAGCATGEEPYSLAILLDRLLPDRADWALTIIATDINAEALAAAQRGHYRAWALRDTPSWIRSRYFHCRDSECFELDPGIRQMVTFAPLNLAEDVYPTLVTNTAAMDLILCRNVLMYFTREAQRATAARLQRALVHGGWLAVSPAEASASLFAPLVPVIFPGATVYRKEPTEGQGLGARGRGLGVGDQRIGIEDWVRGNRDSWAGSGEEPPQFPAPDPQPLAPHPQPPLERARALADQGKLEAARRLCEVAIGHDRLDPEAHFLLATICQERGEIPAALEALRRALYLDPDSGPANFLLGSLLLQQGRRSQGQRAMETVVRSLGRLPRDVAVPGGDGLTAGRLVEIARDYLVVSNPQSASPPPSPPALRGRVREYES